MKLLSQNDKPFFAMVGTESEWITVMNALRVASEVYEQDARLVAASRPQIARQLVAKAIKARNRADDILKGL